MDIDWITSESEWGLPWPLALQQSWAYGQAMARLGACVRHAVLRQGGQVIAAAQMLERRGLRVINRPPVQAGPLLRRLARFPGLTLCTGPGGWGFVPLVTPRFHAEWDLRPEPEDLRRGLRGKWRNRLLRGESLPIRDGSAAVMMDIAARCDTLARQRGFRALPPGFLAAWEGGRLVLHWSPGGRLAAGIVVLIHGRAATYHIGWTSAEGRAAQAHAAMLWQAALALRGQGMERFDLGPVDAANPGLARFKLGTGARLVSLGPSSVVLPG